MTDRPAPAEVAALRRELCELHDLPVIGEPVPLELVNTAHTWEGEVEESLPTPGALAAWCTVVLAAPELTISAADLVAVHRLRRAVTDVVAALGSGTAPAPDAMAIVNADVGLAAPTLRLADVDGRLAAIAAGPPSSVDEVRGRIAAATVDLVAEVSPERVRGCANPPCGMVFLAEHGRRRFCTPECSGDDRQRRFRARHRRREE